MTIRGECFACGSKEHLIQGPDEIACCHRCATSADASISIPHTGPCSFCGKQVGKKVGFVRRQMLKATIVKNGLALCSECVNLMKDIVAEKTKS